MGCDTLAFMRFTATLAAAGFLLIAGLSAQTAEPLYPSGQVPLSKGSEEVDVPALAISLPPKDKAVGTAVVVCPGGGYRNLAMDHEGKQIAEYLNNLGVVAAVLKYRLGPRYHHPAMLMDAQRAIRTLRSRAAELGIAPQRIGIMGFSAGGHLASTAGTHFDQGKSDAADAIERVSSRPDFLILCYPVISMTSPFTHKGSRTNLLGDSPDPQLMEMFSNEKQVTAQTPPTFLFHTDADTGVPAENSVEFYLALRRNKVPAEMHIYQKGPHGVGLAQKDPVLATWSGRLTDWLRTNGWLTK